MFLFRIQKCTLDLQIILNILSFLKATYFAVANKCWNIDRRNIFCENILHSRFTNRHIYLGPFLFVVAAVRSNDNLIAYH